MRSPNFAQVVITDAIYDVLQQAGLITDCPTTETYDPPLHFESGDVYELAEKAAAAVANLPIDVLTAATEQHRNPDRLQLPDHVHVPVTPEH